MSKGFSKRRLAMGEEAWREYQRNREAIKNKRFQKRHPERVIDWRRETKIRLIEYKGGKCEKCGYDKYLDYPSCFDFHHKDPKQKDFGICARIRQFDIAKKEVDKCQLLCRRCHGETHEDLNRVIREETKARWQEQIV